MINIIESTSFGNIAERAREVCAGAPMTNLILSLQTKLPASGDNFLKTYEKDAKRWQSPQPQDDLLFTHGEYMHRHGDSLKYLVAELKNKPTGNRACISLVDGRDIMESRDGKLPSFLLLQAAVSSDSNELILTSYYRALEVSEFLPINLAEMAFIADEIWTSIPALSALDLTIHAFRAHNKPGSRAHVRSQLDTAAASGSIRSVVQAEDRAMIAGWLVDKARPEFVIDTSGLAMLAAELSDAGWAGDEVEQLSRAIGLEMRLAHARTMGTHAAGVDALQKQLSDRLDKIARTLRNGSQS